MKSTLLFTAVLTMLITACKKEYVMTEETVVTSKKAKVENLTPVNEPLPLYAAGKVESKENIQLSFKTGGIISRIYVSEGQFVQKGQILAILDLEEINARVTQANANVEKVRRDVERFERLYNDSAATLQNVLDLQTSLEVAESELRVASFNQRFSQITAPENGRILRKRAENNELVNPGQPILSLGTTFNSMVLKVGLSDRDVVRLGIGDSASVSFDAYPGKIAKAEVVEIAPEGHPVTGTFEVELLIQNFPFELKNGFFAKSIIYPGNQDPYYKIPMYALVEGLEEKVAIYIPDNSKVKRVVLTPEYIGQDFFTVSKSQVNKNSLGVITEGASFLREGEEFEAFE